VSRNKRSARSILSLLCLLGGRARQSPPHIAAHRTGVGQSAKPRASTGHCHRGRQYPPAPISCRYDWQSPFPLNGPSTTPPSETSMYRINATRIPIRIAFPPRIISRRCSGLPWGRSELYCPFPLWKTRSSS